MKQNLILIGMGLSLIIGCRMDKTDDSNPTSTATELYDMAREKVIEMQYDSATFFLHEALEQGMENPMRMVHDSHLYSMIEDSTYRPKIRSLLEEFAVEHQAKMVRESEPGIPIGVKGRIVDESSGSPLENVRVELVQTDKNGNYFEEKTSWNPRLFAYLVTDGNGEFEIQTIRPGAYRDDDGNDIIPSHIHFTLKKKGYRMYGGEFTFEDDSIIIAMGNVEGIPLAHLKQIDEKIQYEVIIPMQTD